jgi:hypothetical protein
MYLWGIGFAERMYQLTSCLNRDNYSHHTDMGNMGPGQAHRPLRKLFCPMDHQLLLSAQLPHFSGLYVLPVYRLSVSVADKCYDSRTCANDRSTIEGCLPVASKDILYVGFALLMVFETSKHLCLLAGGIMSHKLGLVVLGLTLVKMVHTCMKICMYRGTRDADSVHVTVHWSTSSQTPLMVSLYRDGKPSIRIQVCITVNGYL